MKIKRLAPLDNVGFNMTPMIDVVFQLIVFLMLAMDFSNRDLEAIQEPIVPWGPSIGEYDRIVVNIAHKLPSGSPGCGQYKYDCDGNLLFPCQIADHWKIILRGKELNDRELLRTLKVEADLDRNLRTGVSNRSLMIRPDAAAPYALIRKVLEFCSDKQIRIWRTEIGVRYKAE